MRVFVRKAGKVAMDDKNQEKKPQEGLFSPKNPLGVFARGIYLGCETRVFGGKERKFRVSEIAVAFSGTDGALSIAVPEELVQTIQASYTLGQEVLVLLQLPRANGGRIYYTALSVGDIYCGG